MPQIINLPGGQTASFPDNMPKEQIESVLQAHYRESVPANSKSATTQTDVNTPSIAPQESLLSRAANNPVTNQIIAAGSGIRQGLTDFGSDIGGFITELVGKANAEAGAALRTKGRNLLETMAANEEANTGATAAQAEFPLTAAIGKATGYVGGATGASLPLGAGLKGIAAQSALGSAMAGEGNRIAGAAGGALLPVAAKGLLKSPGLLLSSSAAQEPQIKSVVKALNSAPKEFPNMNIHEATNASFAKFKDVEGNVLTTRPQEAVSKYLDQYSEQLSPKQLTVVNELKSDLASAKTLEELHNARKNFTQALNTITKKDILTGKAFQGIQSLRKTVENNLQANASRLGVLDDYKQANSLFKQSKEADIINDALTASQLPEGGNNWLQFNNRLIKLKADKERVLSPQTKQMLSGVQKTLTEANHLYGVRTKELGMLTPAISIIKGMFNFPAGQAFLIKAGSEPGRKLASGLVKAITNTLQAHTITGGQASEPIRDSRTANEEIQ